MRKISILLLFIATTLCSYSQQDTIRFTTTSYAYPDISVGDIITISDTMYNTGPSVLDGPVSFGATVNNVRIDSSNLFPNPSYFPGSDSFIPNIQYPVVFHVVDSIPPFEIGPNTVVIWPIYNNNGTQAILTSNDSIRIAVISYPLGIIESPLAKMYIFQTPGRLNINFGDAENLVQQVRIYDMSGQSMYANTPDKSKNIPTAGWSMGVYLCEIITFGGETKTFKFRLE